MKYSQVALNFAETAKNRTEGWKKLEKPRFLCDTLRKAAQRAFFVKKFFVKLHKPNFLRRGIMTWPEALPVLFSAGIFLLSFLALLLAGMNAMLSPIKKDIGRLEEKQVHFEKELTEIKENQVHFEKELTEIKAMLSQVLQRQQEANGGGKA